MEVLSPENRAARSSSISCGNFSKTRTNQKSGVFQHHYLNRNHLEYLNISIFDYAALKYEDLLPLEWNRKISGLLIFSN